VDTAAGAALTNPVSDEWDAAFQRVESYLRAMHIRNRPVLNSQVARIVERTRQRLQSGERRPPVELAGEELMRALARWFRGVLNVGDDTPDAEVLVRGRMALIMSELTPARQALVLSDDVHDDAFIGELQRAYSITGPNFEHATMRARPLDLGVLPRAAEGALEGLDRWPRVRMVLVWTLLLGLFALIFYFTR
jgi:hypothetical protein